MRQFKKGYMLNTFPGRELPLLDKFKLIKQAGFEGVEPPGQLDAAEILEAQQATGLAIPSVSCGQQSRPLSDPDPAKRAAAVEGVKKALRKAKRYGASSIAEPAWRPAGIEPLVRLKQIAEKMDQIFAL